MKKMLHTALIILFLMTTSDYAHCVTSTGSSYVEHPHSDSKSNKIRRQRSININVVNIIIDKIENNLLYSKDGQVFTINESAKIINNHNSESAVQIGELFFEDGKLITIILK
jgi:hypothetical protein